MKTALLLACGTVVPFGFLILAAVLIWRAWRYRRLAMRDVAPAARKAALPVWGTGGIAVEAA